MSAAATPVIDAHHHFWHIEQMPPAWHQPNRASIARDYGPADLAELLGAAGVDGTVLMQAAQTRQENTQLFAYADEVPFVAGVVGWLPLADPSAARAELRHLEHDRVRGVRCLIERDEADWLVHDDTLAIFRELADRGLTWDVVPVTTRQVEHVRRIAEAVPELRIVADHLARPPVEDSGWEPWASHIQGLSAHPTIALKVSIGIDLLEAWPAWEAGALEEYISWVVECFGPERLMMASNWPVVELRREYTDAWVDQLDALRRVGLRETDLAAVQGGTAIAWYGLTTR